jgi:hypothetical protein
MKKKIVTMAIAQPGKTQHTHTKKKSSFQWQGQYAMSV